MECTVFRTWPLFLCTLWWFPWLRIPLSKPAWWTSSKISICDIQALQTICGRNFKNHLNTKNFEIYYFVICILHELFEYPSFLSYILFPFLRLEIRSPLSFHLFFFFFFALDNKLTAVPILCLVPIESPVPRVLYSARTISS